MELMRIGRYFALLGAPLKNIQWSWGAERADGTLILRVWEDEKIPARKPYAMRVTARDHFASDPSNLGWRERQRHLEKVKGGARTFMVMCHAVDPTASPRQIKDFDSTDLFLGGALVEYEGDLWLEIADRRDYRNWDLL